MDTKLTLRLDERVIQRAKDYAKKHKISLSKMIENYLNSLTRELELDDKEEITPFVESLSGIINLPEDYNLSKDYTEHLTEKHQ
ncbi:MAG: DUF6364 family protein [Bacteroidales bacterium]|nr:DUF6364 family protein [Bacteroidales bacterium]